MHPGESQTLTVDVGEAEGYVDGKGTFLVQIYNVKNALLSDGSTRWEKTVTVAHTEEMKYTTEVSVAHSIPYVQCKNIQKVENIKISNTYDPDTPDSRKLVGAGASYHFDDAERVIEFPTELANGAYALTNLTINHLSLDRSKVFDAFSKDERNLYNRSGGGRFYINSPYSGILSQFTGDASLGTFASYDFDTAVVTAEDRSLDGIYLLEFGESFILGVDNKVSNIRYSIETIDRNNYTEGRVFYCPEVDYLVTLRFQDMRSTAQLESLSAPVGTYYAGQNVPITAKFNYPLKVSENMTITVNETKLTPQNVGTNTDTVIYLYTVDETSGGSISLQATAFADEGITCTGANERDVTVTTESDVSVLDQGLNAVHLESIDRADAFVSYNVGVSADAETKQPQLVVTVPLAGEPWNNWVLAELANNNNVLDALQVMTSQTGAERFSFKADGAGSPAALTATVPLPYNTTESDLNGQVDFLLDGAVLMGKGLDYTVSGSIPVAADDLHPVLTVTPESGDAASYQPGAEVPLLYAQQNNALALSFTLNGAKDYTWGNTAKVTHYNEDGSLADTSAHFAWKSSDRSVATVTVQEGKAVLTPTGQAGTADITLVALNGGVLGEAESKAITVTFAVGGDPFLLIPDSGKNISIRQGQDAVVSWTSNLCAKNETDGKENGEFIPTTFHVRVTYTVGGQPKVAALPEEVLARLTTTQDNKTISSVTIPWAGVLEEIYNQTARSATVEIWAEYAGKKYGTYYDETQTKLSDTATAVITMISQPASVTLFEPEEGLYQTDSGGRKSIPLSWKVPNLDTVTGGQFELYIAGGGLDEAIRETTVGPNVTLEGDTYHYTLTVPAVELDSSDASSYRDSYTITVKAKNSNENTWAYDSYVLYVYSSDALELLLDGEKTGSHTMSNRAKIAALWNTEGSDGIVALKRDIALKNVISINYGDYAWAELADQIAWNSSDSSVASVNYQQGTLYENIENFSYTSYRPSTDFVLSGLKDGTTTITATHVKTGIKDTMTVQVNTLRDQLYLFQCYPKQVTTLTYEVYTSAAKTATEQMTLDTNKDGEAAIYAPYGIAGDVYCQSVVNESGEKVTYVGTIYSRSLVSSEADSTKLQLYPVNTLQLRRAAQAEIYLKNPNGTPYEGQVTFRGGVYRQGEYCDLNTVKFGLQGAERSKWEIGSTPQTVKTDANGRLLVTMDLMQFKTSADQKEVQAGEKLYYLFQLEYGDGDSAACYPILLRVDATLNLDDIAASGDSIVVWEKNDSSKKVPFIAQQTLKYSNSANANVADVRKSTGSVGPSTTFPTAYLTTTVMWWGDEHAAEEGRVNSVLLRDTTGKTPDCQATQAAVYPFTDLVVTENVMTLTNSAMSKWGIGQGEGRSVQAVLSEDGATASRTLSLPFKIVNMIGVEKAEGSAALSDSLTEVKENLKVSGSNMSGGDKLIQAGMALMAGDSKYDSSQETFAVRLFATSDPTVFRAFFCLNIGEGVYPDYADMEDMTFVDVADAGGGEANVMPGAMDVYHMLKGDYLDNVMNDAKNAAAGKGMRDLSMTLGGYFEADIAYNSNTGKWECRPVSGGFHVSGGVSYTWYANMLVGPVPVVIDLTLGGSIEVSMDMQRGNYYVVEGGRSQLASTTNENDFAQLLSQSTYSEAYANDYLTKLRVFLYIRAFAGLGFDVSVVACKIGVFGQLNGDFNFSWLNRSYLKDSSNISAVGPVKTRTKTVMDGQEPRFSGSTGIEFVFKFLFISYEKTFCSVGFELKSSYGDWDTIEKIWAANKTINDQPVTRMALANGQVLYAIDLGAQLESRDYVDAADQVWVGGRPSIGLFSLDPEQDKTLAEELQTGAYSYANPVLSDDGAVMFYLSDRPLNGTDEEAKDVTNTRVAVSTKNSSGQFQVGNRLDGGSDVDVGYGDSNVKVAGSNGKYAAVWVRQMADYTPASGDGALTEGQQLLQMNSTEIIAAISTDDSNWTLTRLTNNSIPDLAPVVSTNGTRTVVAWREVSSSGADTLTSFDQQDAIRYQVYNGSTWSETQTLYDGTGTGASIRGIEAAMMEDGTAAVVYTLDTDSQNDSNTDWETVVALIPSEGTYSGRDIKSEDTVRTFRLTTDSDLDENPQITTAEFDDDKERFVVAWHTERKVTDTGETESDIRMAAIDADGVLYENMPESLGQATDGTGETIGSNFRFAKNTGNIENLSILWVDSVSADEDSYTYDDSGKLTGISSVGRDVLKAVKLVKNGRTFTLSGAVAVAEMAENTLIDHFDACMSDDSTVKSVILGSDYSETAQKTVTITDSNGNEETATISLPVAVTGMYTATAEFTNQLQETAVMLAYDELYPNSEIDVQFTIRNTGKDAITALSIEPKDGGEPYYTTAKDPLYGQEGKSLNLLPNRDITLTAKVPTNEKIEDTAYIIKAAFKNGNTKALEGTLYLDIPDVGISKVTTVEEADGQRTLRYSLYNALSAKLADPDDDWQVQVGFYADQGCTTPLKDKSGQDLVMSITDKESLALIDAGGYSAEVTIPVDGYAAEDGELPSGGVPIYVKAWIEKPVSSKTRTSGYDTVNEYYASNNTTSQTLDNLAARRNEDVTLDYTMSTKGGSTTVTVTAQYNKLTGTSTGNLIVTLLDAQGNPIAKQQSYSLAGDQLLNLVHEGTDTQTFTFAGVTGGSVQVEFSNLILDEKSTELDHVSLSGAAVTYDPASKTYTAAGAELTSGILEIAPKDPKNAIIAFDGQTYNVNEIHTIRLPYGTTEWKITVTNGGKTESYTLVLNNTDTRPSGGGTSSYPVETSNETAHGTVSVSPRQARSGQTVTITANPDEGYQVGKVTVTRPNGAAVAVTGRGNGVYTFIMPGSKVTVDVTFVPVGAWTNPFIDVPDNAWYYDGVKYVNERGLMAGTSANTFAPERTTTRGMIVTILYRLEGAPNMENEIWGYPFQDVDVDAYYGTAVYWARMNGIVTGYSDELFGPDDTITRQQIAAILFRYAQYKGYDVTARADLSGFADVSQVAPYALEPMRWANAEGLVAGTSATTLSPNGSATRAQAAVILTRFCQNIAG